MSILFSNRIILCKTPTPFRAKTTRKSRTISARLGNSQNTTSNQQQQLNLSVLRFTLGIPGLDESYLPRWMGYGLGSLLLLNHFVGSNSSTSPAQLISEALGLLLAAFSIAVPYFGRFLKGATPLEQEVTVSEGTEQIFVMSQNISDTYKEDLAWASYVLLRNTNSISVIISIQDSLCARGYWNTPSNLSKSHIVDWFKGQTQQIGLSDLNNTLYFPQGADFGFREMLPKGTCSLLIQPVLRAPKLSSSQMEKTEGFVMLASSISYAYSDKDRAWIRAVANKL